jgi:hypothetical protein
MIRSVCCLCIISLFSLTTLASLSILINSRISLGKMNCPPHSDYSYSLRLNSYSLRLVLLSDRRFPLSTPMWSTITSHGIHPIPSSPLLIVSSPLESLANFQKSSRKIPPYPTAQPRSTPPLYHPHFAQSNLFRSIMIFSHNNINTSFGFSI